MMRPLHRFHGGIHPQQHKKLTRDRAIEAVPVPDEVVVTLHQGVGSVNRPIVSVGDPVKKGQRLSECFNPTSVPIHSPCTGTVTAIEKRPFPHPSGMEDQAIVIRCVDNQSTPVPSSEKPELQPLLQELSPEEIVTRIRMGGVIGLGGAGFPTSVKVRTGTQLPIRTLIINGMECEPYITCDDALMREQATEIIHGIEILDHLLRPEEILVGVEDNKPEAIQAMKKAADRSASQIEIITTPTIYPSGGERQLIKILTGQEVPSGGLPHDLSILCQNVATASSIYHTLIGEPLTERLVTVTGDGVERPGNYRVPIGMPIEELLQQCAVTRESARITVGGPMMGFPLLNRRSPITKTVNCLIVEKSSSLPAAPTRRNCIRCAACSDACPALLLPQQLYWAAQSRDFERTEALHLFDCIECGCCNHVCPSHIPLVEYYRHAKGVLRSQQHEQKKADRARNRHEFRDARLLREKEEKARKLAKKRAALKAREKSGGQDDSGKKEAIRAAIERAKAKRSAMKGSPEADPAEEQQAEKGHDSDKNSNGVSNGSA